MSFILCFPGILLSSRSPPVATPLEPCRVAPYVSLATIRSTSASIMPTPTSLSSVQQQQQQQQQSGKSSVGLVGSRAPSPSAVASAAAEHFSGNVAAAAAFSAFDPALISAAAHQVNIFNLYIEIFVNIILTFSMRRQSVIEVDPPDFFHCHSIRFIWPPLPPLTRTRA